MVRTLLLQQLYNLSDEQLEFQLLDRLSFQRFAGLRHSSQIPDRTTFWTFRERLAPVKRFLKQLTENWINTDTLRGVDKSLMPVL